MTIDNIIAGANERSIEFIKEQDKQASAEFWREQLSDIEAATDICVQKSGITLDPNKPIKELVTGGESL